MQIAYPYSSASPRESKLAGLASAAGLGMIHAARELAAESVPAKRMIASPFGRRDLTVGTASAGGYLVGTVNRPPETPIERFSIVAQSGARVVTGLAGPITVPRVATSPTASWVIEGGTMSEVQPTLGQLAAEPKFATVYTEASRQILLQGIAEEIIDREAMEAAAVAIDAAAINGSGSAGQPMGLLNLSGIGSVSGTSFGITGFTAAVKACLVGGAQENRLAVIAAPDVRELLGKRETFTGAGPMWINGRLCGIPAVATPSVPDGTLILGDWSRLMVCIFDGGAGVQLMSNPYANFRAGIVGFALTFPVDFIVNPRAAFAKVASIT